MEVILDATNIQGFDPNEAARFNKLIQVYNNHSFKNAEKNRYYEGKVTLNEVNLGIALPENLSKLEI